MTYQYFAYTEAEVDYCALQLFTYEKPYPYVSNYGLTQMNYYEVSEEVREIYRNKVRTIFKSLNEIKETRDSNNRSS